MSIRPLKLAARLDRRRVLVSAAALALLATRSGTAEEDVASTPAASPAAEWSFTDDTGTTITLPARPERVVAYLPLAAALWDFGIRPIAVYGTTTRPDGSPEVFVGNVDLDTVEALGEEYGELDLERLVALQPDLLVNDYWFDEIDVWGIPPEAVAQIETWAPIVHIRFVERPVTATISKVEALAAALGADPDAPEVVAARERFAQAEADLRAAIAEKPGLTALFLFADSESVYVGNVAQMSDLAYFKELGLDVAEAEGEELWEQLSWEQVAKYPADLILTDARSFGFSHEELAEIPLWNTLPAVQADQLSLWQTEYIPTYDGLAAVLEELAAAIRAAGADVVD